jgi:hypothetical protein
VTKLALGIAIGTPQLNRIGQHEAVPAQQQAYGSALENISALAMYSWALMAYEKQ